MNQATEIRDEGGRSYLRFADMVVRRRVKARLYQIWDSMKKRCEWPQQNRYARYGGRGIRVCTIFLALNGVTKPLPQWAEELGLPRELLRARRSKGWTDEQILTTPKLTNGQVRAGVQHAPRGRKPKSSSREGFSSDTGANG